MLAIGKRSHTAGHTHLVTALCALLALAISGCAHLVRPGKPVPAVQSDAPGLTVVNQTTRTLRIHLIAGTTEVVLGTIPGLTSASFSVPPGFGGTAFEFRIQARARGGAEDYNSESFILPPGRKASWVLLPSRSMPVKVR
jgi:hypothetical protein